MAKTNTEIGRTFGNIKRHTLASFGKAAHVQRTWATRDPDALVFKDRLYGRLSADICGSADTSNSARPTRKNFTNIIGNRISFEGEERLK